MDDKARPTGKSYTIFGEVDGSSKGGRPNMQWNDLIREVIDFSLEDLT